MKNGKNRKNGNIGCLVMGLFGLYLLIAFSRSMPGGSIFLVIIGLFALSALSTSDEYHSFKRSIKNRALLFSLKRRGISPYSYMRSHAPLRSCVNCKYCDPNSANGETVYCKCDSQRYVPEAGSNCDNFIQL